MSATSATIPDNPVEARLRKTWRGWHWRPMSGGSSRGYRTRMSALQSHRGNHGEALMTLTALSGARVDAEVKPYDCGALRVAIPLRPTTLGHINGGQSGQEGRG